MDPKDYQDIRYEVDEGRARIALARPDKHNAMTPRLLEELEHALWEADEDLAVHSVILRGEGPSFCSGYDLTALGGSRRDGHRTGRTHDDDIWMIERGNRRIRALWEIHKPVIARVHGNCLAGGTDLAMACDLVIAADDARIGFPAARAMGALPNNLWMYHCGPQWRSVSSSPATRSAAPMRRRSAWCSKPSPPTSSMTRWRAWPIASP